MSGKKSTRDRIKLEGLRMVYDLENAMMRLQRIAVIADGKSPVINQTLPELVQVLDMATKFVERFRGRL